MGDRKPTPFDARQLATVLSLVAAVVVAAGLTRLVPDEYRPYNFTAVGALALFAAARLGLLRGLIIVFLAMLTSDLLLWYRQGYDRDYLPIPSIYLTIAGYSLLGWWFLRRTENPLRIGAVAVGAGLQFYLITNFLAWYQQALPYGYSLGGLMDAYRQGIPFYRGTLMGDVVFSGLLFGAHAALVRVAKPVTQTESVKISE